MKKKYYLLFAFVIISFNFVWLLISDNFIVGFPLPFYTVTLEGVKCSDVVCPDVLLPRSRFHILNLIVDIFLWTLMLVIFGKRFSNRTYSKKEKL